MNFDSSLRERMIFLFLKWEYTTNAVNNWAVDTIKYLSTALYYSVLLFITKDATFLQETERVFFFF